MKDTRRRDIVLPDLGLGQSPIKVSLWLVSLGSHVYQGDPVVEVLAGNATVDLPAPASGVLAQKLVAEDEPAHVGQRLGVIEQHDPQ